MLGSNQSQLPKNKASAYASDTTLHISCYETCTTTKAGIHILNRPSKEYISFTTKPSKTQSKPTKQLLPHLRSHHHTILMANLTAPTSIPTPPPPTDNKTKIRTTKSPFFKRVLVYNYSDKSVRVTPEKTFRISPSPLPPILPPLPNLTSPPLALPTYHNCYRLRLPFPCPPRITIFVDSETEAIPSLRNVSPEGEGNVELARLHLNMMGWRTGVLRWFGGLRALYVVGNGEEERRGYA